MGGGASSTPIDPLAGAAPKTAPPLQTVSGKPAPIVSDTTTLQLGEWESFFLNAGIGGALQGQLTARRERWYAKPLIAASPIQISRLIGAVTPPPDGGLR